MTVYNMSKIKEWYEDFNSCKSNYLNNYYQNYKSSYIVTNNDSSVSKMQKKLDGYYSRLKNAYSKVGNAWKNLYNDLMNADAALAGQKSSGSVNASGASAKISSMPKLVEYKNDLGLTGAAGVSAIAAGTVAGVTYSAEQVQSQAIQTATLSTQAGVDQVSQSVSETTEASKGGVGKTLGFAAAGAATGAAIASVIPGIGTAIGGLVGAGVGALIGSGVVSKIKDWFVGVGETVKETAVDVKNKISSIKDEVEDTDGVLNKTNFENSVNRKIDFLNRKINKLDDFKAKNNINLLIKNGDMPISELNGIKPSNIERYISQYKHNIESIKNLSFVDNVIMTNKEKSILDTLENVIKTMDDKYGESVGLNTIKRYINGSADLVNITSTNNCRQQISKYSREELLNVYKLRNNIEEAKLYATNLNVKNFSDKFSKFVSQDKIDKITENVIFTSSDAMTVFYRKGVNGFNDSLNSYVIINGNRTIENVKATTAHENLHAISWGRDSNGNLIAGVSISKKYTALNEAFTEYINKISFGENYPINRNSGYMGMVSRLKTLVDSGVVDNNDIQYAYFKNDISNLKNKIDSKAGDGYFDKIVDAFDNSWKNYTNNKMGNNSYLELDKLLMNLF